MSVRRARFKDKIKKSLLVGCVLCAAVLFGATQKAWSEPHNYYAHPSHITTVWRTAANDETSFSGTTSALVYDASEQTLQKLRIAIDATTLDSKTDKGEIEEILSPRQYPEITLASNAPTTLKDNKGSTQATLTIHGTAKTTQIEIVQQDTQNPGILRFKIHALFAPTDFGLKTESDNEKATLSIDLQAMRP